MEYREALEPVDEEPDPERMDETYRAIVETCDRWRLDDQRVEALEEHLNLPHRLRNRVRESGERLGERIYSADDDVAVRDAGFVAELMLAGTGMTAASYAFDRVGTGLAMYGAGLYRTAVERWADVAEDSLIQYADNGRADTTGLDPNSLEERPLETAVRAVYRGKKQHILERLDTSRVREGLT